MAEQGKKSTTRKKAEPVTEEKPVQTGEKTYTEAEVTTLLSAMQAQIEALQAQISAATPTVTVNAPERERVTFRWQAPVSDDNVLEIGENGRFAIVTGRQGTFFVPKDELGRVLTPMVRNFLRDRWLIVLDGLDEAERAAYGVDYKPGEVLDSKAFMRLVDLGSGIMEIYPKLCVGNRRIVSKLMYEAWKNGGYKKIKRNVVKDLEDYCSANDPEEKTFQKILAEMNEKDAERK